MRYKKMKELEKYIIEERESHYRFAFSYMKNESDALDVLQDSIVKAISKIDQLRNVEAMKSWFFQIISYTAIDALRKKNRVILSDHDLLDYILDPQEDIYESFDLIKAMDELPENYQTIVRLRYFESFKIEEIAHILGENVNTIKTRLYTALKKLRLKLEEGDF